MFQKLLGTMYSLVLNEPKHHAIASEHWRWKTFSFQLMKEKTMFKNFSGIKLEQYFIKKLYEFLL